MVKSLLAEVMDEAGRLGLKWWERVIIILALAVASVMGKEAIGLLWNAAKKLHGVPQDVVDEGGIQQPGTPLPLDPNRNPDEGGEG